MHAMEKRRADSPEVSCVQIPFDPVAVGAGRRAFQKRKAATLWLLSSVLCLLSAFPAFAWGDLGHQTIAFVEIGRAHV